MKKNMCRLIFHNSAVRFCVVSSFELSGFQSIFEERYAVLESASGRRCCLVLYISSSTTISVDLAGERRVADEPRQLAKLSQHLPSPASILPYIHLLSSIRCLVLLPRAIYQANAEPPCSAYQYTKGRCFHTNVVALAEKSKASKRASGSGRGFAHSTGGARGSGGCVPHSMSGKYGDPLEAEKDPA